jgi:hypothetical protein
MDMQGIFSLCGSVIAVFAAALYIRSILKGETRPHRVTWGGWTLVGLLGLVSSREGGAGVGLVVTAVFVVTVALVFLLSLSPKYGKPGGQKIDLIAGAIAGLVLLSQLIIDYSPAIGATVAVLADIVFLWPTVRESWSHPEHEALHPWVIGALAEALGVMALGNYSFASSAYSVYILCGNMIVIGALLLSPWKKHAHRAGS